MTSDLLTQAVRNNAEWCDALCRGHGLPGVFSPHAWTNPKRTPLYYPEAVTLSADASAEEILAVIDTRPGSSVKDSFGCLDLAPYGFVILFEAQWIQHPAGPATAPFT